MSQVKKVLCANPACGIKFKPTRANQRFHAPKCRVAAARALGVDPETGVVVDDPTREAMKRGIDGQGVVNHVGGAGPVAEAAYDREKNLAKFIKMGIPEVDWISTGIPEFDELTMIPRGRITQIQGRFGVGKTTLCLNMIKGIKGTRVLYIDTEAALNPHLLVDLEIDPDLFTVYNDSAFIEDIADVVADAAKKGTYDLIVLDSVPMTISKTIADSDITAKDIGQKAFILNKLVARIAMNLKRTNTAMVFVNQVRDFIGGYVPKEYTPGGTGIPYQASLIVHLKTIPSWRFPEKPKDKVYLGHEVLATLIKSKVNIPHRQKKFKLWYPEPRVENEQEPF